MPLDLSKPIPGLVRVHVAPPAASPDPPPPRAPDEDGPSPPAPAEGPPEIAAPIIGEGWTIYSGRSEQVLRCLPDESIDAIVTDPPAGIGFMGKEWDDFRRARNPNDTGRDSPFGRAGRTGPEYARGPRTAFIAWMTEVMMECYRVLKPGGHGFVWALPRTSHWTAMAAEEAGFEVRDVVMHVFGTGFPKSLDVSKAIDKAAGAEREVVGARPDAAKLNKSVQTAPGGWKTARRDPTITASATDDARRWQGWGTALKPAAEHWILVRKPLSEKNIAANVLRYGTGALNIDGCRIAAEGETFHAPQSDPGKRIGEVGTEFFTFSDIEKFQAAQRASIERTATLGRFPANFMLSHGDGCRVIGTRFVKGGNDASPDDDANESNDAIRGDTYVDVWDCGPDCPVALIDAQSGFSKTNGVRPNNGVLNTGSTYGAGVRKKGWVGPVDAGGASRFFYVAKPTKKEKNAGGAVHNTHPTPKPIALMRYLIRMVTPPDGVVLDPFLGSGTTLIAAIEEGVTGIGIEQDPAYVDIARGRLENHR